MIDWYLAFLGLEMTQLEDPTADADTIVVAIDLRTTPGVDFAEQLAISEASVRHDIAVALLFNFPYLVIVKKRGLLSCDVFLAVHLPGLDEVIKMGVTIGCTHGAGRAICMAMPKSLSHTLWKRIGIMRSMTNPPAE